MSRPFCANYSTLVKSCSLLLIINPMFVRQFHFFIDFFIEIGPAASGTGLTLTPFDGGAGTIGAGGTGPAAGWTDPSFGASGSSVNGRFIVVRIVVRIYGLAFLAPGT